MEAIRLLARALRVLGALCGSGVGGLLSSAREGSWVPLARNLRIAFEGLGPGLVKLGQFLSVRPDLLGAEAAAEFERLLDSTTPVPFHWILRVLETELGAPPERLFRSLDPLPIASASVSQVHRALLPGGEEVAVKVQKPGAEASIARDLKIVGLLLRAVVSLTPMARRVDVRALWREVVKASEEELDFRREAESAEAFRRNFRQWERIRVPRIYWGLTSRRVLTAEFMHGTKISDPALRGADVYAGLAELGARAFLKQVFVDGFFHADLHPANILITTEGRIVYLDFGIVGRLSPAERRSACGALAGLLARDAPLALRNLAELGIEVPGEGFPGFAREVGEAFDLALGARLGDISAGELAKRLLGAVYRHRVTLPRKYALLLKGVLTIEGTARGLHPDFHFERAVREYVLEERRASLTITALLEAGWRGAALLGMGALSAAGEV